jgi:hypothetical protein
MQFIRRLLAALAASLQSEDEAYLAHATDLVDLERRLRELEHGEAHLVLL